MLLCWSSRYRLSPFPAPLFRPSFPRGRGLSTDAAAVQIFDCSGQLCGRIIWLRKARDTAGRLARDDKNPDPVFRQRPLCGLTILQGLQPADLTTGTAARSTTRRTGRHTASRQNSARPMYSSRASIWACRSSARPRPCCGSRGSGRKDGASAARAAGLRSGGTADNLHGHQGASCRPRSPGLSAGLMFEKSSHRPTRYR